MAADMYTFNNSVELHDDCSAIATVVGNISAGETIAVTEIAADWYHTIKGWAYGKTQDGESIVTKVGAAKESDVSKDATADKDKKSNSDLTAKGSESATGTDAKTIENIFNSLRINNLQGVYGMPYQYMEIADRRLQQGDDTFGRKYAEKIVSRMPLLVMVPGSPEFLSGYSKKDKEGLLGYILDTLGGEGKSKTDLDSLINRPGKYYGLSVNWTEYFNHVNPMCRAAAKFLGVENEVYLDGTTTLANYEWQRNSNEKIHSVLNYRGGVAFYINSETQISDSFSNSTTQSMLASKVNGISDLGREMNFLLGGSGAITGMQMDKYTNADAAIRANEENKQDMTSKLLGGGNLMQSLTSGLKTVIAGGKLIFPEIWSDSQFSRDYDINIKLTSPDCDNYSIYINIIVPLLHLIGFVCPRSTGPNGYVSPFLVRAFYKGLFNCDMGIITNMSINKGAEGSWTNSGIPTVVDVHLGLKELYGTMAISTIGNLTTGMLNNSTLMDYIANLCGININEPDLKRTLYFYYSQFVVNRFRDKVYTDVAGGLDQWATNKILNIFKGK